MPRRHMAPRQDEQRPAATSGKAAPTASLARSTDPAQSLKPARPPDPAQSLSRARSPEPAQPLKPNQSPRPADPPTAAGCDAQQEIFLARRIRARSLVAGLTPGQIARKLHDACGAAAGTSWIRAHRLALGISLADVVAQVRAWYVSEGRAEPRFSETLLSAYESGQKRPGPQYLHYLCAVYRADPPDLGYPDPCLCGRGHGAEWAARAPAGRAAAETAGAGWAPGHPTAALGYPAAGPEGGPGPARPGQVGLAGGQGQPG